MLSSRYHEQCKVRISLTWQNILLFSGLRGLVSAALILTLPETFPYKGEFQCLAFVAIAASLIIQPVLIRAILQRDPYGRSFKVQS